MARTTPSPRPQAAVTPLAAHNHGTCVASLLHRAPRSLSDRGLRLTALRQAVLEEIAASHDAVGAYDVIARLALRTGTRCAPISVYRAIDALREAGLVHRLESRNAYFACHAPHAGAAPHAALVCETCSHVVEVEAKQVHGLLEAAAAEEGFVLRCVVVEGVGRCATCTSAVVA